MLGPMPARVRATVRRLIAVGRPDPPNADERINGLLLTAGPCGASYLDADGEVWNCSFWEENDSVEDVPDGPTKVGLIAIAAERIPELSEWLPRRPTAAKDCKLCDARGSLQPPWQDIQCPECSGMGWVSG
jgi:hypothetical protein